MSQDDTKSGTVGNLWPCGFAHLPHPGGSTLLAHWLVHSETTHFSLLFVFIFRTEESMFTKPLPRESDLRQKGQWPHCALWVWMPARILRNLLWKDFYHLCKWDARNMTLFINQILFVSIYMYFSHHGRAQILTYLVTNNNQETLILMH